MYLLSRVGIRQASPTAELEIAGAPNSQTTLRLVGNGAGAGQQLIEAGVLVNQVFQPGASIRFNTAQSGAGSGRRLLAGGSSINITSDTTVINSALEVRGAASFDTVSTCTLFCTRAIILRSLIALCSQSEH